MPALASARLTASTGPMPKNCGSTASTPVAVMRASGSAPSSSSPSSSTSSSAAAPSESCDALPAVTVPSGRNDGLSDASDSAVTPSRMPSSRGISASGTCTIADVVRAGLPRRGRLVLRPGRELVGLLPGDAVLLTEQLRALAEADRPLVGHVRVDHPPAERRGVDGRVAGGVRLGGLRQHVRRPGHRLHAARDHDRGVPDGDRACGGDHGVESRGAEPVDGRAGHRGRQAGEQRRHAGDVAVVLTGLVRRAEVTSPMRAGSRDEFRESSASITTAPRSSGRTPARAPPCLPIGVRTASTTYTSRPCTRPPLTKLHVVRDANDC